jgi:DNA-binding transcriptional MerR regulator
MQETKKENLVTLSELAKLAEVRRPTLKYYNEIGILPHQKGGDGLIRFFNEKESLKRFIEIKKLREIKRRTIKEIVNYYKKNQYGEKKIKKQ